MSQDFQVPNLSKPDIIAQLILTLTAINLIKSSLCAQRFQRVEICPDNIYEARSELRSKRARAQRHEVAVLGERLEKTRTVCFVNNILFAPFWTSPTADTVVQFFIGVSVRGGEIEKCSYQWYRIFYASRSVRGKGFLKHQLCPSVFSKKTLLRLVDEI